ncbi:hypothetical protein ACFQMB_03800 [Pseudobowmanella zhangzhouensis]
MQRIRLLAPLLFAMALPASAQDIDAREIVKQAELAAYYAAMMAVVPLAC